jgi:protein-tyrosine phosphatase
MPKVLFVCMGNICRSPAAEGVFKKLVSTEMLEDIIEIDSAGTIGYHSGELPDARMRKHALQRGYDLISRARQFNAKKDFEEFDYIVTMDDENYENIVKQDREKKYQNKIFKMTEFSSDKKVKYVPDPYYGGADGFENVLDILEDSTKNLLKKIKADVDAKH